MARGEELVLPNFGLVTIHHVHAAEWRTLQSAEATHHSWEHIARSSCLSIDRARRRLGDEPSYTSLSAVQEAVSALIAKGDVQGPMAWG